MRVVVDANILIAALLTPKGWSAKRLQQADGTDFIVPAYVWLELAEHGPSLCARRGIPTSAWERRVASLRQRLRTIERHILAEHGSHALVQHVLATDEKDAAYAAALVATETSILWTRDRALLDALPGIAVIVPPEPGE